MTFRNPPTTVAALAALSFFALAAPSASAQTGARLMLEAFPKELTLGLLLRRHGAIFAAGAGALLLTNLLGFAVPKVIGWFIDGTSANHRYDNYTITERRKP